MEGKERASWGELESFKTWPLVTTTLGAMPLPDWTQLAAASDLAPDARLLLSLSGGADSVWLLHALASARPRPPIAAAHIDHGLRGRESTSDLEFCADLCAVLRIPFCSSRVELAPTRSDLEARARRARYTALARLAREHDCATVLTAHHRDDALETLLMRWARGTELTGLAGLRRRGPWPVRCEFSETLTIVRPLLDLEGASLRADLRARDLAWREDSSNLSGRFTRNRVRHRLLPWLVKHGGEGLQADLHAFHDSVRRYDESLAGQGPRLEWQRAGEASWTLGPAPLRELTPPECRRALWRLLVQATGKAPRKRVLEEIATRLADAKHGRWTLKGAWDLRLTQEALRLHRQVLGGRPTPVAPER